MQGGREAETALIALARESQTGHRRGEASSGWLKGPGAKAVGAIKSGHRRRSRHGRQKQAVFALSQLPKDEGVPKLNRSCAIQSQIPPSESRRSSGWASPTDPRAFKFLEETLAR